MVGTAPKNCGAQPSVARTMREGRIFTSTSLSIRAARQGEAGLVLQFVRELAEYEKLTHEVVAAEAMLDAALFGENPRVFCDFAEWNGEPVGFAVWFLNFSTFNGKSGIYLEDLFVRPAYRGRGTGKALM